MLANVMRCHQAEAHALSTTETMTALTEEFTRATGMFPESMEHRAQMKEVYLQARLASLDCLDTDQVSVRETHQSMLRKIAKPVSQGFPMQEAANPQTTTRKVSMATVCATGSTSRSRRDHRS